MSTYIEFDVLKQLNDDFLKNIKIISVFGHKVSEVLIVNKDDTVFGFGENDWGVLGFGHNRQVFEPKRVEELSGKGITKFVNGFYHVIGLTNDGKIYSWGRNYWPKLGNGMRNNKCNKPEINEFLINEVIINISCGYSHSLVLTEKYELFVWGYNDFGQIGNDDSNNELNSNFKQIMIQIYYYIKSELLIEILESVDYLHKRNPPIIHRDLKPANVLISHGIDGRFVKFCDFGLAKLYEFDEQSHTTGVGTLKYMAPEVLTSQKYNTKAEVYSIAVVIQELIKDFKEQFEAEPESTFLGKYKHLLVLVVLMMKEDQELRPNCESILNQKSSWALSINDIENNTLFEEIINNSFSIEESFHSFFIKKKLEISKY